MGVIIWFLSCFLAQLSCETLMCMVLYLFLKSLATSNRASSERNDLLMARNGIIPVNRCAPGITYRLATSYLIGALWEHVAYLFMSRLHYVAGGHGSHVSGQRGRNVAQRKGTGWTNVDRRGCRGRRGQSFKLSKSLPRQPRRK